MNIRHLILGILVLTISSCSSSPKTPERAIIEPTHVTSATVLEAELNSREGVAIPKGESWFKVIEGSVPVIITAPHSTRPLREGNRRFSDGGGTAALAVAIGELTGAYVIYTTYEGPSDPNYYDNNQFKEELGRLINEVKPNYILDLHGSDPYRPYDVDLGTMDGNSLLGNEDLLFNLIEHLREEGIVSISYNRFGASDKSTITKYSTNRHIPAIQMEINGTYIMPSSGKLEAQRFSKLLQGIVRFIGPLKKNNT